MIKSRETISCIVSNFENDSAFLTNRAQDVSRYNTNVPCDWSVHFLCQRLDASLQERPVGRLPKNRCNSGNLGRLVGLDSTVFGRWLRSDLRSQKPRFGEFDGTEPSTASVYSIFPGQMTTFHQLPGYRLAQQVRASFQIWDWPRLFLARRSRSGGSRQMSVACHACWNVRNRQIEFALFVLRYSRVSVPERRAFHNHCTSIFDCRWHCDRF